MRRIIVIASLLILSITVSAQSWQDTVLKIEKLFTRYKPNNPGAQVTISRNGQVLYSKAWGMADLEHNAALTSTSPTEAGSVSKQFTAAAILLLEQEGKLSLDDDVRKHLPELPDYGTPITLRQMMQHTSGLKDWGALASIAGWPRSTKTYNNDDALQIISRQKTLNHTPGDEFIYSNSNYNLFAVIVQRLSGMSLYEYSRKKIFEPAGMNNTEWRANFKKVVPNRAMAYAKSGNEYITNMPNEYVYGNGGLLTTTEDLVKWTNFYTSNKLGAGGLLPKQVALSKFNNGSQHNYAAGLFIQKFRGIDLWVHDGATASYRANLDYFPSLGLTIAFLTNTSEFDRDTLDVTVELRRIFLSLPPATAQPSTPVFNVSADKLAGYEGWYRNSRSGAATRLTVKSGVLTGSNTGPMKPVAENEFVLGTNKVVFQKENKSLHLITPANDVTIFTKEAAASLNEADAAAYAGEYYSEESDSKFRIVASGTKLIIKQKPGDTYELTPTYKDGFDAPFGAIYFERDKKNRIKGFYISVSRARNVSFVKL